MDTIQYAGFWRRFLSFMIDGILMLIFFLPYYYLKSGIILLVLAYAISCILSNAYIVYFHGRFGQTLGKMIVGIKVKNLNGSDIDRRTAFVRSSVDIAFTLVTVLTLAWAALHFSEEQFLSVWSVSRVSQMISSVAFSYYTDILNQIWVWSEIVVILFNKKKRAVHDYIAGTVVVVTRPKKNSDGLSYLY